MLFEIDEFGDGFRLIAIDPGTNTCGFAVLDVDVDTWKVTVDTAYTVKANRFVTTYKTITETYSEKTARLHGYNKHLVDLCETIEPFAVCSEAPFMGRFAAAYGALKEQVKCFHDAAKDHDQTMPFLLVEPTPVKKFMGVKGNSGDKDLMSKALCSRSDILYGDGLNPSDLDEHSVDAVCVGLYWVDKMKAAVEGG
jgi:Holliday junction resolvasome RuvABC endonuclease subunit